MKYKLLIMLVLVLPLVLSIPPIPTEFYGTATVYDYNRTPLAAGTWINISAGNVTCGEFTVINPGYYGSLSCMGDDNYTAIDEGAVQGQNIIFNLNGELAYTIGDTVWYTGEYQNVNITIWPRCGNGFCEVTESCLICPEDCGECVYNGTGGTGTGIGGGGTSGGGGGGGTGSGDSSAVPIGDITPTEFNISFLICQEDWHCTEWYPPECPASEFQTRECNDINECQTEYLKPDTNRTCEYAGSCDDLVKNQDETDIDCGGLVCDPCDIGKKCRFDFDCKTDFCNPIINICQEPTCNDQFRNQGEEGVDCGGPCPPCERPTLERPETVTRFIAQGCGPFPWLFVLLSSFITVMIYIAGRFIIKDIQHSRDFRQLSRIEQLNKLYDLNRRLNVFVILVVLLETAISMYFYYFCEIAVWIIIMLLVIIPLIVGILIKSYVYDERRKNQKLHKLVLQHITYLDKLIKIERTEVRKEEQDIVKSLSDLDYEKIDKFLAVFFKDVIYSIKELISSEDQQPLFLENNLVTIISDVDKYINNYPDYHTIFKRLKFIQKIHSDILLLYKDLRSEQHLAQALETTDYDYQDIIAKLEQLSTTEEKISFLKKFKLDNKLRFILASQYHKSNKLDDAEQMYVEILKTSPKNKPTLYYLGMLYYQKKDYHKAYDYMSRLLTIDPKYLKVQEIHQKLQLRVKAEPEKK